MSRILRPFIIYILLVLAGTGFSTAVQALSQERLNMFSQNNILFYDPTCTDAGTDVSVCNANLPSATVQSLESNGVKEKAEQNIERYKYAEEQTGIPWQAIAALHYREAGMASDRSISNGQRLTSDGSCYTNVDGLQICGDPNQDAKEAAEHLIEMAKWVYGVELSANSTVDEWGQAFLAYNRGVIYKRAGVDWKESPYPMNGFDDAHALWMQRPWIENTAPMYLTGKDLNVGALAVFAYLCGSGSESGASSSNTSTTTISSKDITLIGDSISVAAENELKLKFPSSFLNKVVSRHPTSRGSCSGDEGGLATLKKLIAGSGTIVNQHASGACETVTVSSNSLKENVVWELGTNAVGATRDTIEQVVTVVGNRNLFLVTPYDGKSMNIADSIAEMYRDIANSNDNVYIVDWNQSVRNNESKYITRSDGMAVHPTDAGKKLLAKLIEEALQNAKNCDLDISSSGYKERLSKLDGFNQFTGPYEGIEMCPGTGKIIHNHGCGMMSLAAVYYMFTGKGLNDQSFITGLLAEARKDGYQDCSGSEENNFGTNLEKYTGLTSHTIYNEWTNYSRDHWDELVSELKQGNKVIIGVWRGDGSLFAQRGHNMMLDHYDPDKDMVYLFDPAMSSYRSSQISSYVKSDDIQLCDNVTACDGMYVNRKAMHEAVKPSSAAAFSDGSSCYNLCATSEGIVGNLTEEQSQNLADYYNGPNVSASTLVLGMKNNCVSFSLWFAEYVAGLGTVSGNGRDVAHSLAQTYGLEEGTEPKPLAVFSVTRGVTMCGSELCGHTGIVVAVDGDDVTVVEAAYRAYDAKIVHHPKSYFVNTVYGNTFTYLDSKVDQSKLSSILGG